MKISSHKSLLVAVVALLSLPVILVAPNLAKADAVSVSPPRFELFGNPGDTISEKIKVGNDSTTAITYQTEVDDFDANGDQGGINLIGPDAPETSISLAHWISVEPSRFTVAPNDETTITYTIKIPKTAEPGGKYASVLIKRAGEQVDGGAEVDTHVGSLILLRVSGNISEKLSLDSFKTDDTYYQHGPINLALRTTNTGNVHVAPTGKIVITDTFGHKVTEINLTRANVLPTSSRVVATSWDQKNMIGRYTATLVATYGDTNQTLSASTTFIVIPVGLIVAVIVVIVLLILMVTQRKRFKRFINRLTAD